MRKNIKQHFGRTLLRAMLPLSLCFVGATSALAQDDTEPVIAKLINDMVLVRGGTFTMGATDGGGYENERPTHEVEVSTFYICKYEVSQELWQYVMGRSANNSTEIDPELPVNNVSWNDAQEFVKKLNLLTKSKFRLPYEAEWEFAARGGRKEAKSGSGEQFAGGYSGSATLGDYAWYIDNADGHLHKSGLKKPNQLGLYDMSGNVCELCLDWWTKKYDSGKAVDPQGPEDGDYKIYRGGSYVRPSWQCRLASRFGTGPDNRRDELGLRLVMEVSDYVLGRALVVTAIDGTRSEFVLSTDSKVKVADGYLVVNADDTEMSFELDKTLNMRYENVLVPNGIDQPTADDEERTLNFSKLPADADIAIYSLDGKLLYTRKPSQNDASVALPLNKLTPGAYIVKVNGITYKISKR